MKLTVNGEIKDYQNDLNLANLINLHQINKENCVAELNGSVVPKENIDGTSLKENDKLELVRFIGGG